MNDTRGDGVCLDLRHSDHGSGRVRFDDSERRNLPVIFRLGERCRQAVHPRLERDFLLLSSGDRVRVLLRSYCGRHAKTDSCDGRTQRRRFLPGERRTDSVQTSQVEHRQDDDL